MKMTKKQQEVVDLLMNGNVIWLLGNYPYIAMKAKDGSIKSVKLHKKTFEHLANANIIQKKEDNRWYLKE